MTAVEGTSNGSRTTYWVPLICIATVAAGLMWLAAVREDFYVRMMDGPFVGAEYSGDLPARPTSKLELRSGTRLEVYELPAQSVPVLVLRTAGGKERWKRLMKPIKRYANGSTKEAWLRELELHDFKKTGDGVVVSIACNWEFGGREGGRLYLDEQLNFREFKLSW